MNNLLRWRDEHHMLPLLLITSIVILLAIAAAALWARGSIMDMDLHFASVRGMQGAYARVEPGRTSQSELASLGFDSTRLHARSLSGLGVQEYFMPRTSEDFDRLDPAVRACFEAPDRCSALVFPVAPQADKGGFMAANAAPGEPGRIVFLMKSGRVAYKAINGI
jgi:hypothetical protein